MKKLGIDDLENGDVIWVKEFNSLQVIKTIHYSMSNIETPIEFDNGKTVIFNNKRKFELG